jgi:hypothetical protein
VRIDSPWSVSVIFFIAFCRYCPPKLATLGVVWGSFSALGECPTCVADVVGIDLGVDPGVFVGSAH